MTGKMILISTLLVMSAGVCLATKDAKLTTEKIIDRWADGPVRYVMTRSEYEAVADIKSIPELARFITGFWLRRDPTRGTFENEYRRTYWGRVLEANRRFRDSTTPGWKTDRGKVFIILGEPDDIVRDEHPEVAVERGPRERSLDSGSRGIERWTYRRRLSRTAAPEFVIAFVRDESLDWKLSGNPDLLQPYFPGTNTLDARNPSFGGIENRSAEISNKDAASNGAASATTPGAATPTPSSLVATADLPALDTSLFANYDLGLETSVPSNTEAVLSTVTTREFLSAFPATSKFEFFQAKDGSTFVNAGGLVPVKDLYGDMQAGTSTLRVYASLVPAAEGGSPLYATNEAQPAQFDLHEGAAPGGLVEVWTGLAVAPGRYRATLAIEDSLTGRLSRASADIEVPDLSPPRRSLSSLVLASSLSEDGGRLGVKARSSGTFRKAESFGIYYEVYGTEAKQGAPLFDVTYRFYREVDGALSTLGKPISFPGRTEAVQGWSFPLAKWPAGKYRLEVAIGTPVADGEASVPTGPGSASPQNLTAQVSFEVIE